MEVNIVAGIFVFLSCVQFYIEVGIFEEKIEKSQGSDFKISYNYDLVHVIISLIFLN